MLSMQAMHLLRLPAIGVLLGIVPLFFIDLDHELAYFPPELHAFAHVGFSGVLALVLIGLPRARNRSYPVRAAQVVFLILLLGIAIELLQPIFGRSAGLSDIIQNLTGAAAGVSLQAPSGIRRRVLLGACMVLLILELQGPSTGLWDRVVARTQFPVLSEFETPFEHGRWSSGLPDAAVARAGSRSMRIELQPGEYPGTTLQRSFGDWSDYAYFEASLYNPDSHPLPVSISIRDQEHFRRGGLPDDRFDAQFTIEQGWNDLRIPVAAIRDAPAQRRLELSDLAEVVIFTVDLQQTRVLHLDRVRLSRE